MINNGANFLRSLSPEYYPKDNWQNVSFEIPDFYGSDEKTLFVLVAVKENGHYTDNEIEQAHIINDLGNPQDVYPFLTESQKHDIRLMANDEI